MADVADRDLEGEIHAREHLGLGGCQLFVVGTDGGTDGDYWEERKGRVREKKRDVPKKIHQPAMQVTKVHAL